jgi:hypothetical protein
MTFVLELLSFMRERRKFWLIPLILLLGFFALFIVATSGSVVAPFIYTLF